MKKLALIIFAIISLSFSLVTNTVANDETKQRERFTVKSVKIGMNFHDVQKIYPNLQEWRREIPGFETVSYTAFEGDKYKEYQTYAFMFLPENNDWSLSWFDFEQKILGKIDHVVFNADLEKSLIEKYGKYDYKWVGLTNEVRAEVALCWGKFCEEMNKEQLRIRDRGYHNVPPPRGASTSWDAREEVKDYYIQPESINLFVRIKIREDQENFVTFQLFNISPFAKIWKESHMELKQKELEQNKRANKKIDF